MTKLTRTILVVALGALSGAPLSAQRGRGGPPPTPPDTSNPLRKAADGKAYALDFQQQDLRVVLSAVAEAGGLNVTLNNIPSRRIDLRMGVPASREAMLDVLKGLVASNGLTMVEGASLIRVEGPATTTPQQQLQQAVQQQQLRIYEYRLKHASAVQLAPVLMQLFTGAVGGNNVGGLNINGIPGFQILGNGAAGAGGGGRGGGRGGGAGGATSVVPGPGGAAAPGAVTQPAGVANALGIAQAFQQAGAAALSASAANVRIVAEETTNSLLVRATAEDWILIQQLIGAVDLRPLQVLIEVTIAEVERTHDLNVGISGVETKKVSGASDTVAQFATAASARDFIAALTGGKGSINYNIALNALQTRGDVRVLSLPVVIAQNNRQAVLNVGQRVPFVQITAANPLDPSAATQTIAYQDVGTKLTITPTINQDGYVNLQIDQTDNSATNDVQFNAPVITEREATTQIFIHDGQTTVIGGLSGNTKSHTTSGIPFLSRIPWIGGVLFGNTQHSEDATELYLFLTPHIISSDEDIERLRRSVQSGSDLLHDIPIQRINPGGDTIYIGTPPDSIKRPPVIKPPAADSAGRPRKPPPDSISGRPEAPAFGAAGLRREDPLG